MPTILVVEDSPSEQMLIKQALIEVFGNNVSIKTAHSIADVGGVLIRDAVDAVVLDLMLPDGRGFESLEALRRLNPTVPVVIVTGLQDGHVRVQARAAGIKHFINKDEGLQGLGMAVVGAIDDARESSIPVHEITRRLDALFRLMDNQAISNQKLMTAVFGNGVPGLVNKVEEHERFITQHREWSKNIERIFWLAIGAAVTSGIGAIISWAFSNPSLGS